MRLPVDIVELSGRGAHVRVTVSVHRSDVDGLIVIRQWLIAIKLLVRGLLALVLGSVQVGVKRFVGRLICLYFRGFFLLRLLLELI